MVLRNEYKRRQGAPGVRITEKAFDVIDAIRLPGYQPGMMMVKKILQGIVLFCFVTSVARDHFIR